MQAFEQAVCDERNIEPDAACNRAVDTSTSRDLAVSGQLANAGKTIALESCLMQPACGARPFTRRRA
jgi:hypothetical protein